MDSASETSSHPSEQQNAFTSNSGKSSSDFMHSQYYSYSRSAAASYPGAATHSPFVQSSNPHLNYGSESAVHDVYNNHTYAATGSVTASDIAAAVKVRSQASSSSRKTMKPEAETDGDSIVSNESEDAQFSRDEKRARSLNIPIPTCDIINLPIDEFNEKLAKYDLTEAQLSLIRDIRRRGKNKVAAQNCRKRKMDQIHSLQTDVDRTLAQKVQLESRQAHLLSLRELARDKYAKLYKLVLDSQSDFSAGSHSAENAPDDPRPSRTIAVLTPDPHLPHDMPTGSLYNMTTFSGAASSSATAAAVVAEVESE